MHRHGEYLFLDIKSTYCTLNFFQNVTVPTPKSAVKPNTRYIAVLSPASGLPVLSSDAEGVVASVSLSLLSGVVTSVSLPLLSGVVTISPLPPGVSWLLFFQQYHIGSDALFQNICNHLSRSQESSL